MDMTADPPFQPAAPDVAINVDQSIEYWNSVSADDNGMLGGFPQTSRIDLQGSSNFLTKLRRSRARASSPKQALPPLERVVDCGAGIGRITKALLMDVAETVDVVEPVKKFTDELVASLEEDRVGGRGQVGRVVNLGLQDWIPEPGAYDLIWNQWCLGHLTDAQLVTYLRRCKDGLARQDTEAQSEDVVGNKPRGWIVVKENMSADPWKQDIYDDVDSSVTRSDDKFRTLFKEAGLVIVATELQKGFPKELFPVRMYALRPE